MNKNAKLKDRRKELGLTMLEVSQKVGVSEATISRWESGDIKNIRQNHLSALAKALQVSPAYILDSSDSIILESKFPIISKYNRLNDIGQIKAESYIDGLLETALYCRDALKPTEIRHITPIQPETNVANSGNNEGELPEPPEDIL